MIEKEKGCNLANEVATHCDMDANVAKTTNETIHRVVTQF